MSSLNKYFKSKFPSNWKITVKDNFSFSFRDNLIERGKGYFVEVQEESNKFEATIYFEDFAKEISNYAENRISKEYESLKKLVESNNNLTTIFQRKFIEINLDPTTSKFDSWELKLLYKKKNMEVDSDIFSDIILSFILYIFPYSAEAEEEGSAKSEIITKYERSHLNRSMCLAFHGYNCKACGERLKDKYGDVAREFIHVHHLNPISKSGNIIPDPINDFVPLCPNCHSIAHLRIPPYSVDEIQKMIKTNGNTDSK